MAKFQKYALQIKKIKNDNNNIKCIQSVDKCMQKII